MHVPIENAMMSLTSATHQSSEAPGVKVKGQKTPNSHPILVTGVTEHGDTITISFLIARAFSHQSNSDTWVASLPLDASKILIPLPSLHDCQTPEAFGAKLQIKSYLAHKKSWLVAYVFTSTIQWSSFKVSCSSSKIEIGFYADGHHQFKPFEPLAIMERDEMARLLRYVKDQAANSSMVAEACGFDGPVETLRIRDGGGCSLGGNPLFQFFIHSLIVY